MGVGDSESTGRAFRIGFPSSVCCACETKTPVSAPSAQNVINQTRKRTTESQRNRVFGAINPATKIKNEFYARSAAGSEGAAFTLASRSRRRIAFNFPPSSRNKQVRYIQVSKMMIDASAR